MDVVVLRSFQLSFPEVLRIYQRLLKDLFCPAPVLFCDLRFSELQERGRILGRNLSFSAFPRMEPVRHDKVICLFIMAGEI